MKLVKFYIVILVLVIMPWRFYAQDITVGSSIDTNVILIGDQTYINVELIQPKTAKVYFPIITDKIGEKIEVLNYSEPDTVTNSEGNLKIQMKILVTSFDTGYLAIPPFEFKYNVLNDTVYSSIETQAMLLAVFPLKVDLEKGIADIKPIIEEPFRFKEIVPYIILLLLIVVIIAIGIYVYFRVKNKKPIIILPKKPVIPPHIIAKKKLDELNKQKLWQNGAVKDYYSQLTDIMREYMEDRFVFNAMEMVSDDIIANLHLKNIEKQLIEDAKRVLILADFAKFAKVKPMADENSWSMKWAYLFVEKTKLAPSTDDKEKEAKL